MTPPFDLQFADEQPQNHLDRFGLRQQVTGLHVVPGPGYVTFRFRTTVATVPIVEVFEYRADTDHAGVETLAANAFPLFAGPQLAHEIRIDGLAQAQQYVYAIRAPSDDPEAPSAPADGSFVTSSRMAQLFFDDIVVKRDGDPNGDGEMMFRCAVYDTATEQMIAGQFNTPRTNIGDGTDIDSPFGTPAGWLIKAPKTVTVFLTGDDSDTDWSGFFSMDGLGGGTGLSRDRIPPSDHGETETAVWANAAVELELPDAGHFSIPFRLDSGPWGVAYRAWGRLEGTVAAPPPE
jgi:hypothetical protein